MSNIAATRRLRRPIPQPPEEPEVILSPQQDDEYSLEPDLNPMAENFDDRVHNHQERLSQLRREVEQVEREKQQLEDMQRKQHEFMQGRTEMVSKLSRGIASLERETYEAQKKVEQFLIIKDAFAGHLETVDTLNPEDWNHLDINAELTRAIALIDDAREEYQKCMLRVQSMTSTPMASSVVQMASQQAAPAAPSAQPAPAMSAVQEMNNATFRYWAFCGLAFTLPVIALGLIGLLAIIIFR